MPDSHSITIGDRLFPISRILLKNNKPVDLTNYTVKWTLYDDAGTLVTAATTTGVTAQPTTVFTASATTNLLTRSEEHTSESSHT